MWLKKLRRKKGQSLIIILIVILCSALMTGALVIMTSWQKPYEQLKKECQSEKARIYLTEDTKESAELMQKKFLELDNVSRTQVVSYSYQGATVTVGNDELIDGFICISETESAPLNMKCIDGELTNLSEGECLISAAVANMYDIQVGDYINAEMSGKYFVKGIFTNPFNMNISYDSEIFVKELPKDSVREYYINVYSDSAGSGESILDDYRESNDGILEGRGTTTETRISNNQMTDQIFGAILLVMSILILLVSGVMIRYLIKNTMLTDRNSIAIYKTLGYLNSDISGIYLKMYLFLVLIGSIAGVFVSTFISDSFTTYTYLNLGVTKSGGTLWAGIVCVAGITAYVMFQVYLIVRKTKNVKPMEVFRGTIPTKMKLKKTGKRNYSFSSVYMALRMMKNEKKNTIIIIITCVMAVYCVNFGVVAIRLIEGMESKNYYWIGFDKHDVSLEVDTSQHFQEQIDFLEKESGVAQLIKTSTDIFCTLPWEKGIGDTTVSSMVYETYEGIDMPTIKGRNPKYENEIALGEAVADRLGKTIGDYMDIYINGQKTTLLICGTFQCFYNMGNSCRLLEQTVTNLGVTVPYKEASIYLEDGYDINTFIQENSEKYGLSWKLFPREEKYDAILSMVTGPQMVALKPFITMVLLLGGLNIIAVIYLKNKSYAKIFATYKAMGYSSRHLMLSNMCYVGMLGLGTILITVPLFMFCFPIVMVMAMSVFGFKEYPVTYDMMALLVSNGVTLLVFVICGLVSSINLYRNPIRELTEE